MWFKQLWWQVLIVNDYIYLHVYICMCTLCKWVAPWLFCLGVGSYVTILRNTSQNITFRKNDPKYHFTTLHQVTFWYLLSKASPNVFNLSNISEFSFIGKYKKHHVVPQHITIHFPRMLHELPCSIIIENVI